jgi:hypothetical protein
LDFVADTWDTISIKGDRRQASTWPTIDEAVHQDGALLVPWISWSILGRRFQEKVITDKRQYGPQLMRPFPQEGQFLEKVVLKADNY